MPKRCELEVTSDLENLEKIADFVMEAAERAGLSSQESFQVQMAVDEACTNIMQYAYGDERGSLQLCCNCEDDAFSVTITDHGKPFDPDQVPAPDLDSPLEDRSTGGLGIFFMRKMMDEIHFEFSDREGNRLTMVKRIGEEEADADSDAPAQAENG
jgi:anti-sigma regulatory factor (Ser/Thr protein kinase)